MKKYDIVKQAKLINVITAACMLAAGLVLIIFSQRIQSGERFIVGSLMIVYGAGRMLGYFSNDMYRLAFQFDFSFGIFSALIGVLFIAGPAKIIETFPAFVGLYVILEGLLKIQIALDAKRFGINKWAVILATAIAVVFIGAVSVASTYISVFQNSIAAGAALVADGAENVWITAYTVRVRAQKKNFAEKYGIDINDGNGETGK